MIYYSMKFLLNIRGGRDKITVSPHRSILVPTLNWVIKNQIMMLVILIQPSSRIQKKVIEKGREVVICTYIYTIDLLLDNVIHIAEVIEHQR